MTHSDDNTETKNRLSDPVYAGYLAERQSLLESENDYAKSFDRWVITLSGGAIGLTIAFVNDFVGDGQSVAKVAVIAAGIALTITILAALASNFCSQKAHEQYRAVMDREVERVGIDFWGRVRREQAKLVLPKVIDILNITAMLGFTVGVVTLGIFLLSNLP